MKSIKFEAELTWENLRVYCDHERRIPNHWPRTKKEAAWKLIRANRELEEGETRHNGAIRQMTMSGDCLEVFGIRFTRDDCKPYPERLAYFDKHRELADNEVRFDCGTVGEMYPEGTLVGDHVSFDLTSGIHWPLLGITDKAQRQRVLDFVEANRVRKYQLNWTGTAEDARLILGIGVPVEGRIHVKIEEL